LPVDHAPTAEDWRSFSAGWQADLDQRIAMLEGLRDQLAFCIGCGCLSLSSCPLYNPGDVLSARGAGPHMLERP